jgi:hypothetical protein
MNIKIELKQVPVYTSPTGFTVVYDHKGKRTVYDKDEHQMSVIGKSNPHLKEIYELMKFAENHRNHQLTNTIHDDDGHN